MKDYYVHVPPEFEERLADLVNRNKGLSSKIAKAQFRIESLLEMRPEHAGVYFSEGLYRIDEYPFRIHYTIHSGIFEVEITEIDLWLN